MKSIFAIMFALALSMVSFGAFADHNSDSDVEISWGNDGWDRGHGGGRGDHDRDDVGRDHDRDDVGRGGHHGGGHGGWGSCTVSFKKCSFEINGFCVKWSRKSYEVPRRDARWACYRAEDRYGRIKSCYVNCR